MERVKKELPNELALFSEPELWITEEGGITAKGPAQWTEQLKLTYLLGLQSDYLSPRPGDAEAERLNVVLRAALGAGPWGADVFDRWWTVERFGGLDQKTEMVLDQASAEDIRQLTGADAWRKWLIERKGE